MHPVKKLIPARIKKLIVNRTRGTFKKDLIKFADGAAIEIGGPTQFFEPNGPLPFYKYAKSIDNVNYSRETLWGNHLNDDFIFNPSRKPGDFIESDATSISQNVFREYDYLLASHVLEHVANPIKAIIDWRNVLIPQGKIVILVPNKKYTYDINRPITQFDHLMNDYDNEISENDDTHFDEIIENHSLVLDSTTKNVEELRRKVNNNYETRFCHHHVYDLSLLKQVLEFCNFKVLSTDTFRPYNHLIVGEKL